MTEKHPYNAVFKGGGAKGIAYVGALQACEEHGIEFLEVAGSSAGAITATLVACGYNAEEATREMPKALASIGNVSKSLAMIGMRPSLLGSNGLHEWLAETIARKCTQIAEDPSNRDVGNVHELMRISGKTGADVTFSDIETMTGRKLYVVTLDLATRQPQVFSPDLTPDSPVAAAVVASSAIPVAFPAVRMTIAGKVHRLVDGGTWDNYPAFVFHDRDFRQCHDLGESVRPTLGFILDDGEAPAVPQPHPSPTPQPGRSLMGDKGSGAEQLSIVGAALTSPVFRWLAALLPIMFVVLSVMWIRDEMQRPDPWIGRLNENLHEPVLVAVVAAFSLTGILAFMMSFVVIRLGRTIFDTGLVGAVAAIGVGPSVAYWVGQAGDDDHTAVRIDVPEALTTLKFEPDQKTLQEAVGAGYAATRQALAGVAALGDLPESLGYGATVAPAQSAHRPVGVHRAALPGVAILGVIFAQVTRFTRWLTRWIGRNGWVRLGVTAYVLIVGTTAVFYSFKNFAFDRTLIALAWLVIVGTAVSLGAVLLASGRHREATIEMPYPRLRRRTVGQLRGAGIGALLLTVLSFASLLTLGEASFVTASRATAVTGRVVDVREVDDGWEVDVDIDDLELAATLLGTEALDTLAQLEIVGSDVLDEATLTRFVRTVFEGELVDLYDEPIDSCGSTEDSECFSVLTSRDPQAEAGEPITIRADLTRATNGRLFLEQDTWDGGRGQTTMQMMVVLGLVLLGLGLRLLRAARWKVQQPHDPDVIPPAHGGPADRTILHTQKKAARHA